MAKTQSRERRAGWGSLGRARLPAALGVLALLAAVGSGAGRPAAAQRSQFTQTFEYTNRIKSQIAKLDALEQQKLWDEWIKTYQDLVAENSDGVLPRRDEADPKKEDPEFLDGLRFSLHARFARVNAREKAASLKQRYQGKFDADARKAYEEAASAGSDSLMRQVYSRFRHSTYGPRALEWIGSRALDNGSAETARVALERRIGEGDAPPLILFKYALACDATGRTDEARAALAYVTRTAANAPLKLAGRQTTVGEAGRQVLEQMGGPRPAETWPAFGGPTGSRVMQGPAAPSWHRVWEYSYPQRPSGTPATAARARIILDGQGGGPSQRYFFLTFPAVEADRVYVQGPQSLTALSLADGKPLWINDDFLLSAGDNTMNGRRGTYYGGRGARHSQAAPSLSGGLIALRTPVVVGDRSVGYRGAGDFWLSVINSRTGSQLWRRTAPGDAGSTFYNLPALRDNAVYTGVTNGMAGITEFRAVALDAGTGDVLWSAYLGAGSDMMSAVDGSPPSVSDGLVWIESAIHTLSAVDLISGEVRAIYKYVPLAPPNAGFGFDALPQANNPISLVRGGWPVVFAARWGTQVVAIDPGRAKEVGNPRRQVLEAPRLAWDGARPAWDAPERLWDAPKLRWSYAQKLVGRHPNGVFAVDDQNAYLAGQSTVAAYDLATGLNRWTWEKNDSSYSTGIASLAGNRICVLVDGKVQLLDPESGELTTGADLSTVLGESSGAPSVLSLGRRMLVCTRDKVIAFDRDE